MTAKNRPLDPGAAELGADGDRETAAPPGQPDERRAHGNRRPRRGVFARLGTPRAPRSKLRRRVWAGARMAAALALVGGLYAAFAPNVQAEDTTTLSGAAQQGQSLYNTSCITCHGRNGQGVPNRGPSLVGVGSAAVEFQVTTGRMPLNQQQSEADRKKPVFSDDQARDIGAYIEAMGGGPQLPNGTDLHSGGDIADGGELFRVNCSSCHAFGMGGGALSSGKYAPSLNDATDRQIYAAMLTGPENMPVFGNNQLSPQEKEDIIAYIDHQTNDQDPGGFGLGRLGPVPEALVIFLVGIVALVFATLWIAGKS
ncbi:cytochrome c [Rugosimonospora acidiphila]|uniref:Cytochrome bc1 complex cytochrome c subunit n=1 Tax=Rugosimonospora acidiphila TaxID=556531 RepID=A0ABP9RR72_9ACTN